MSDSISLKIHPSAVVDDGSSIGEGKPFGISLTFVLVQ